MATTPSTQPQDPQKLPLPPPLKVDHEGQAEQEIEEVEVVDLNGQAEQEVEVVNLNGQAEQEIEEVEVVDLEGQLEQEIAEVEVVSLEGKAEQEIEEVEVVDLEGQAQGIEVIDNLKGQAQEVEAVNLEGQAHQVEAVNLEGQADVDDLSKQAQWLRAAVLNAKEGLLSTASLIVGAGAVRKDVQTMVMTGVVGLITGVCSKAIRELVSVYSQHGIKELKLNARKEKQANPWLATGASAPAFAVGALVPLLAAVFIKEYKIRMAVVMVAVSLALIVFGGLSAALGKRPVMKSGFTEVLGGWLTIGITFGLTTVIDFTGL